MFINIEDLIPKMKDSELKDCLQEISEYSCFVRIEEARIREELKDAEKVLKVMFIGDYGKLLSTFNGGMLFSTKMYGVNTDDADFDLVKTNEYLHESNVIPNDYYVIAEEDYGDYICLKSDGSVKTVYLYGTEEGKMVSSWENIIEWLMDELIAGEELIANDQLEPYETE